MEHVLVDLLCEGIESFLDKFMAGATEEEVLGWSSRRVKPIPLKTSILGCTLCPFETKTRVALKRHFSIVHEQESTKNSQKEIKCSQCEKIYKSN